MTRERAIETLKALQASALLRFILRPTQRVAISRALEALEAMPAGWPNIAYRSAYNSSSNLLARANSLVAETREDEVTVSGASVDEVKAFLDNPHEQPKYQHIEVGYEIKDGVGNYYRRKS